MEKEEIRKEFFKLKLKGFSYAQCKKILIGRFNYKINIRTLKRWVKRLDEGGWDLRDISRKPKKIHTKITREIENEVIYLRNKTGWGCEKLHVRLANLEISQISIHRILRKNKLCKISKKRNKPKKYIRWQRIHPNSLWQIDHSDQKVEGKWI